MDDGLIEVELPADYGPHKAGEKIQVDPGRATWIQGHLVPRPVPARSETTEKREVSRA